MVECTEVRWQIALDAVKAQFQIDYLIIEQVNSLETFFLRETMLCEPSNWLWEVYNIIQYDKIWYDTIQYNTIQYNAMQCNAIQHITTIY